MAYNIYIVEMQPKPQIKTSNMINNLDMTAEEVLEDLRMQRIAQTLVILTVICSVLYSIVLFFPVSTEFGIKNFYEHGEIFHLILSIMFYRYGIRAAYRYCKKRLRVFAYSSVFVAVTSAILFIFHVCIIIMSVTLSSVGKNETNIIMIFVFRTMILIAYFILTVITIKLAFKLARLLDENENSYTQQV